MLKVHYSNRLENLLERLVEVTAAPLSDPLAPEVIVTQSHGMARWLGLGMAEVRGIAANLEFTMPARFISSVLRDQLGGPTDHSAWEREVLAWRLMAVLPERLGNPGFEPLTRYLQGARPELKLHQLCRRIAEVFDQYLIYRPGMVLGWEAGEGGDWQAQLWGDLAAGGQAHRAELLTRFMDPAFTPDPGRLPERITIFGIPTLAPHYISALGKLAQATEVHLFVLNPCLLYWGDIEEPRNIARIRQQRRRLGKPVEEDYLTSGNSVLASMGRQGRDFIDVLHEHAGEEEELFAIPDTPGVLGILQADILTLEERGRSAERLPLDPADDSFQVHLCHSPMRELEVLHDRLLAIFDADPSLQPRDVAVMTPDIELYAPYIEAVFGAAPEARRIPWSIADLSRQSEEPVVQAFMQLLDLPGSRFTASEVLSLLEIPAVLRRFGLDFSDFEIARAWVKESSIRWGLDGAGRAALGLPELEANTWEFGFRRLFLGYAMAPQEQRLFGTVLPYPHVEGQQAQVLGRLRTFVERLGRYGRRLARPHTAAQWAALGNEMLEAFFLPDGDDAEPLQVVREALAELVEECQRAAFEGPFGLEVLREELRGRLAQPNSEQRFLTGRVTFCAMIPMRSLPFRVVALIGMNDGAFPRQQIPLGFDKMAAAPQRGDRSRREDDRYLFLEALLSARERFYVSYVGRNIRDNTLKLPSVLVTELLDYIDQAFSAGDAPASQVVTIEHPLQPFSGRYFSASEPQLFSYADEWLPATEARGGVRQPLSPFCPEPLPSLDEASAVVELSALCRFFRHPARAFLRQRLGVILADAHEGLEDSEPFALDGLSRHQLHQELLGHFLEEGDTQAFREVLTARGQLPSSAFGERLLEAQVSVVAELSERIRPHLEQPHPALEVDLPLGGVRLVGWLEGLTAAGLVRYRVGKVKPRDILELWVQHLALNALAPEGGARTSRYIGESGSVLLLPLDDAPARLAELLALYRRGLCEPLRLFPETSLAYLQAIAKGKDGLTAARAAWEPGAFGPRRESEDDDYRIAFRGGDPLGGDFEALAEAVYDPLLAVLREGEDDA